jgi:hypothetical protein
MRDSCLSHNAGKQANTLFYSTSFMTKYYSNEINSSSLLLVLRI